MRFEIYEKKEISNKIYFPKTTRELTALKTGKIDLEDLSSSKLNPLLSEIPQLNMEELNKKGKTAFTIIQKTTIVIEK